VNEAMIKEALEGEFPGATIDVQLDGSHCQVTVISHVFEGLRPVARQQRVYAPLGEFIRSGALHAVNIIAKTP
jgi:acid stress-induced BolA-like protein IbaG/YrbA